MPKSPQGWCTNPPQSTQTTIRIITTNAYIPWFWWVTKNYLTVATRQKKLHVFPPSEGNSICQRMEEIARSDIMETKQPKLHTFYAVTCINHKPNQLAGWHLPISTIYIYLSLTVSKHTSIYHLYVFVCLCEYISNYKYISYGTILSPERDAAGLWVEASNFDPTTSPSLRHRHRRAAAPTWSAAGIGPERVTWRPMSGGRAGTWKIIIPYQYWGSSSHVYWG